MHIFTCPTGASFAIVPIKSTMRAWHDQQEDKPTAAINGSFFNFSTLAPIGTVIYDGKMVSDAGNGFGIGIKEGKLSFGTPWNGWEWYISGFPPLVRNKARCEWGFSKPEFYTPTRRSAIAIKDGNVIFAASKGNITIYQLTEKLLALGVDEAIALDGGGSSRLMVNGVDVNSPTEDRVIANAIVCYAREQAEAPEKGKTMNVTCQKKTPTLDKNGVAEKSRYIDAGDKCTIRREITDNLLIEIEYPTGSGKRTAYLRSLEGFISG